MQTFFWSKFLADLAIRTSKKIYFCTMRSLFILIRRSIKRSFDNIHNESKFDSNKLIMNLENGIYKKAIVDMHNDLEYPAIRLCPSIGEIKAKLLSLGFDFVMVSGSGSSVFALTQDKKIINNALSQFDNKIYFVKSCQKVY